MYFRHNLNELCGPVLLSFHILRYFTTNSIPLQLSSLRDWRESPSYSQLTPRPTRATLSDHPHLWEWVISWNFAIKLSSCFDLWKYGFWLSKYPWFIKFKSIFQQKSWIINKIVLFIDFHCYMCKSALTWYENPYHIRCITSIATWYAPIHSIKSHIHFQIPVIAALKFANR